MEGYEAVETKDIKKIIRELQYLSNTVLHRVEMYEEVKDTKEDIAALNKGLRYFSADVNQVQGIGKALKEDLNTIQKQLGAVEVTFSRQKMREARDKILKLNELIDLEFSETIKNAGASLRHEFKESMNTMRAQTVLEDIKRFNSKIGETDDLLKKVESRTAGLFAKIDAIDEDKLDRINKKVGEIEKRASRCCGIGGFANKIALVIFGMVIAGFFKGWLVDGIDYLEKAVKIATAGIN